MQVFVSFSTIVRFVFWLAIAGILAGALLFNESTGSEPTVPADEVAVHAQDPARPAVPAIW